MYTPYNYTWLKDNAKLAAAEEALSLSVWTMATTCRVLSLDSVSTYSS